MQIEIVTIGHEILSGRTLDTNFAFLARALEAAGVRIGWHTTVGDAAGPIGAALRAALARADAVIMTGGLGPTADDVTREAVAAALGRPLDADPAVLDHIRERVRKLARRMPERVEIQALVPRGATAWTNRQGTAPGILIEHEGRPVILLPGVPHEMEGLATEFAVPHLAARTGQAVESFTLRTFGVPESVLEERIAGLPAGWEGAALAYLPGVAGVDLRVTAAGSDAARVRAVAARAREELRARVGAVVYAEGLTPMEEVTGAALVAKSWRIATAESCTGGLLAKRLTDAPGASRYVDRGVVTYSDAAKVALLGVSEDALAAHGAVSAEVAAQMAEGARARAGAEVGVGVTGIAGPGGGSAAKPVGLVFIAVASPDGTAARRLQMPGTRALIRERSAQHALDLVRRHLLGLPAAASLDP